MVHQVIYCHKNRNWNTDYDQMVDDLTDFPQTNPYVTKALDVPLSEISSSWCFLWWISICESPITACEQPSLMQWKWAYFWLYLQSGKEHGSEELYVLKQFFSATAVFECCLRCTATLPLSVHMNGHRRQWKWVFLFPNSQSLRLQSMVDL